MSYSVRYCCVKLTLVTSAHVCPLSVRHRCAVLAEALMSPTGEDDCVCQSFSLAERN